ncbi:MAG TPA: NADH:flavin oxidoreductase/NADH oxidase [Candidatus Angelobacter sp.]|jgi:2,4-dienoyl-CoA reductase-like NADH-dependent reductase (Old Yellow Enzyme family)
MAHLFEPLKLRGVELAHRIVVSPMCQYSAVDGLATDWHFVHLGSRAVGRAAAIISEATAVTADGRISPHDLGIWTDAHVEPLRRAFAFVTEQGSVPGVQLAHAGRKASTSEPWHGSKPITPAQGGWIPIAGPSPIAFGDGYQVPHELSMAEIAAIVAAFAACAKRVQVAGGKIIELHGAHGYLLHSFLSPLSNQRKDQYGGSFANRIRMLCEVVAAVRKVWPDEYPLWVRISASDWTEGGWTVEESVELARILKTMGVDLIDCSSGGNVQKVRIPVGPGYQVAFAEQVRREAGVMTGAVGMITDPAQADQIIRSGQADLVVIARQFLRDPYWPLLAAQALGQEIKWPLQYERAKLK